MRKFLFALLVAIVLPRLVGAQQPSGPEVSDEVRASCRAAALKFCSPGSPPDRAAFHRCAVQNKDRLPPQCSALLAAPPPGRP
jgi:hypothetical protein